MENEQFTEWLRSHCKRFSGVANMINGERSIAADWFKVLGNATVEMLETATREIMRMDPQPFPTEHLGKIETIIKNLKFIAPKNIDYAYSRIESYKCLDCFDRGNIEIYDPLAYKPIREARFEIAQHLRTRQTACDCSAGMRHTKKIEPNEKGRCRPLIEFDRQSMKQVKAVGPEEQVAELTSFVQADWQPRNHNSEFDDWTNQ